MIYIAKCRDIENIYKIGFSSDPLRRIKHYSTTCKSRFDVVDIFDVPYASGYGPERMIHYALVAFKANDLPIQFGVEVYRGEYEKIKSILLPEIEKQKNIASPKRRHKSLKTVVRQLRKLLDQHNIDHSLI